VKITKDIAAVVTGGASGLGEASARAFAAAGVKVAIFDLNDEKGNAIAGEIDGIFCKVDITDEQSVIDGFAKARGAHGQERVLIHCAQTTRVGKTVGKNRETGGFKRFSTEDYEYSILGILVASYRVASLSALGMATLDPLEDGERGAITLTASVASTEGQIGQVAYGSGKAGVNGLVLPMARDLMDLGIRVNSIVGCLGTISKATGQARGICELCLGVGAEQLLQRPEHPARWRNSNAAEVRADLTQPDCLDRIARLEEHAKYGTSG
jgi:NAD(P)-dependent dehydrogenase (short-subunit alcohol dehydrogenase family)